MWMTSDWVVLLLTVTCIMSVLIILLLLSRKLLEAHLSMQWLNRALKGIIVYMTFFIPVIAGLILYRSTFHDIRPYVGEYGPDAIYVIGNRSFSTETGLGNSLCFVISFLVWIAGVMGLIAYYHVKSACARRWLKRSVSRERDESLQKHRDCLTKEYGIKRQVQLLTNAHVPSPFTTGILRCRIFFPENIDTKDRELMLRHELIHCRSQDMLYRHFLSWLRIIYWFNPLLNRLCDYFIEVNEMACDERVLANASRKTRYEYARLLAETAGVNEEYGSICFSRQTGSEIERRIENMARKRQIKQRISH